jgi:hypothetical protein
MEVRRKENRMSKRNSNYEYTFNEKPMDKAHIKEIVRKANKVVRCVWGIGERKWFQE